MGTPYKMKGSPMKRNFGIGSPAKEDIKQTITTGTSKNINTPGWKTTTVNTTGLPNQGTSTFTTLDKTGQVVAEGSSGGSTKSSTKPRNYPNNPDLTKRSYNIKVPKASTASKVIKTGKTILSKASKFLGGKALGVAGMMMATSSKADQPTSDQRPGKPYPKFSAAEMKSISKSLQKSMYKPLPK